MGLLPRHAFDRWTRPKPEEKSKFSDDQRKAHLEVKIEETAYGLRNHEGVYGEEGEGGFVVLNKERIEGVRNSIEPLQTQLAELKDILEGQKVKNAAQVVIGEIKSLAGILIRQFGSAQGEELARQGGIEVARQMKQIESQLRPLYVQLGKATADADTAVREAIAAKTELGILIDTYFKYHTDGEVN